MSKLNRLRRISSAFPFRSGQLGFVLFGFVLLTALAALFSLQRQLLSDSLLPANRSPSFSEKRAAVYPLNLDEEGRMLSGYDVVSYFEAGQAEPGSHLFQVVWQGAQWHFKSEKNREKFLAEPERFMPANGGYCTFGILLSQKLDGDPKIWLINRDRLYIFLNAEVKQKFLQDRSANFVAVAQNWFEIKNDAPALLN